MPGYEQAFHTCCTDGLSTTTLGFQFRAASPGLAGERLAAVGRAMTGYAPPPGTPPTPTEAELVAFPISLRYLDVDGVGPCVSRTVYVGREDRSAPDGGHGRFGNYFSHVVARVGEPEFDATRHPIELWQSSDWVTDVAGPTEAPVLEQLQGGPITVAHALRSLGDPARRAWLPVAFDALEAALADRTRIVVLDDAQHAWAWVAALALALPPELGRRLTFDTFDGEPDRSRARLCVSDPGADRLGIGRKVHTGEVALIDPLGYEPASEPATLLGRAVAAFLADGRETELLELAGVSSGGGGLAAHAVLVGVRSASADAFAGAELTPILARVRGWLDDPATHGADLAAAAALIEELVADERDWSEVDPARILDVADASARHHDPALLAAMAQVLIVSADRLDPATLAVLPPAAAGTRVVGQAIALMSQDEPTAPRVARRVAVLDRLGLLGVNAAVDRRVGRACGQHVGDPEVLAALRELAARPAGRAAAEQALRTAAEVAAGPVVLPPSTLAALGQAPLGGILDTIGGPAEPFAVALLETRVAVALRPEVRDERLATLLGTASGPSERDAAVTALYDDGELADAVVLSGILSAYAAARHAPSQALVERAWAVLEADDPFAVVRGGGTAVLMELRRIDPAVSSTVTAQTLDLAAARPQTLSELEPWVERLYDLWPDLDDGRREIFARRLARAFRDVRYPLHADLALEAERRLRPHFLPSYRSAMTEELAARERADLAAWMFLAWNGADIPPELRDELIDECLPAALSAWKEDDRAPVAELVGRESPAWADAWAQWDEGHPPAGVMGRAMGRLRKGKGR